MSNVRRLMNAIAVIPWSKQGCPACRAVWERSGKAGVLSLLGVSPELHARLLRCEACGAYWEELERYAQHIPDTEAKALLADARDRDLTLILVSNEVGMGVVPATPIGRHYRDILGRVNQAVGSTADSLILMVAGLAVDLRQLPGAR